MFGLLNHSDTWIPNRKLEFLILLKRFIGTFCIINNNQSHRHSTMYQAEGKPCNWVAGLMFYHREVGPLTHALMFQKNSFLLQGSKIIRIICNFWRCRFWRGDTVSQFGFTLVQITEALLYS
jgi:hypothetical protein